MEGGLGGAEAGEVETEHRKSAMRKGVVALVDDLVIHRAVKLRMRMQDHRNRRVLLLGRMITAFETARGAGENNFRHWRSLDNRPTCAGFVRLAADVIRQRKGDLRRWAMRAPRG